MTTEPQIERNSAEQTRLALVRAALDLFGRKGFEGSSTREIAALAEANIGSIAYHFGSKEGLHQACGAEISRRIREGIGTPEASAPSSPEAARTRLETTIRAFVMFLNGSRHADDVVSFMVQELGTKGPAFEIIYETLIEPKHREICQLWSTASGQPADSESVKLAVFAFLGQSLYFRIGREAVNRRMGWDGSTPENAAMIANILITNLRKILNEEPNE